jgi:DNA mismatch endonuclease (patch repair protein)|tara:strand:- start:1681 stop:1926 length:246 start_codon:yes stop_codon:yes gene_type:complete
MLTNSKTTIFIQGCFWHKCPKCYKEPKSNKGYWLPKIEKNAGRDKKNRKTLKAKGYKVICIWEHEIKKNFDKTLKKFLAER